jgi:hypothetical protein
VRKRTLWEKRNGETFDCTGTNFYYTAAEVVGKPEECAVCGRLVDHWYDDDKGTVLCDDDVLVRPVNPRQEELLLHAK